MGSAFLDRVLERQPELLSTFFQSYQNLLNLDFDSPLEKELPRLFPKEWKQAEEDVEKMIQKVHSDLVLCSTKEESLVYLNRGFKSFGKTLEEPLRDLYYRCLPQSLNQAIYDIVYHIDLLVYDNGREIFPSLFIKDFPSGDLDSYLEALEQLMLAPRSHIHSSSFTPTGAPYYDLLDAEVQTSKLAMFLIAVTIKNTGQVSKWKEEALSKVLTKEAAKSVSSLSFIIAEIAQVFWYWNRLPELKVLLSEYEGGSETNKVIEKNATKKKKRIVERTKGDNLSVLNRAQTLILLDALRHTGCFIKDETILTNMVLTEILGLATGYNAASAYASYSKYVDTPKESDLNQVQRRLNEVIKEIARRQKDIVTPKGH